MLANILVKTEIIINSVSRLTLSYSAQRLRLTVRRTGGMADRDANICTALNILVVSEIHYAHRKMFIDFPNALTRTLNVH
jgi:hypothetical protein